MRKELGLTIKEAAEKLGVKFDTYYAWELDRNGVNDLAWHRIKELLSSGE